MAMKKAAAASRDGSCALRWLVIQIRPEPLFHFLQRETFAQVVIEDLVTPDLVDREIFGLRVGEI